MGDREWHIGMCGTFDVENYGDLLFPLIAEAELGQRLGNVTLHLFSYQAKQRGAWPFPVSSLAELPARAGQLDGLLMGGGHLVRFDKGVAPGYGPPTPHIHHPTGIWLSPMLVALQHGCPVAWNAPGAHGDVPAWAKPLLEAALGLSSYVAVRDEAACAALQPLAPETRIDVVPDTAFGVAGLVNREAPSAAYQRLCASLGLKPPYIVVQAVAGLEAFVRLVRRHPQSLAAYTLVVLPLAPILCDNAAIFEGELPEAVRLKDWPDPLLMAELIGRAAGVVGISLHLAVTALAFGVPVFRPDTHTGQKYAVLSRFETVFAFPPAADIDAQWFLDRLGASQPEPAACNALGCLSAHWDRVVAAIQAGPPAGCAQRLSGFWQALPGWLEAPAIRGAAAERERDALLAERAVWAAQSAAALAARNALAARASVAVAERDALYNSTSWKVTAPLRALGRAWKRWSPVR
jgi:lipopolysaccharide transport system ATP-binding protein